MIVIAQVSMCVVASWCLGGAAVLSWWLVAGWVRGVRRDFAELDASESEVHQFMDKVTGELVDQYGNVLRVAPVNPTPELIGRAERAGAFQAAIIGHLTTLEARYLGPGRHRAVGMDAIRPAVSQALEGATTGAFRVQIRREFGAELQTVGPREADLRPTVWAQPELMEVVP